MDKGAITAPQPHPAVIGMVASEPLKECKMPNPHSDGNLEDKAMHPGNKAASLTDSLIYDLYHCLRQEKQYMLLDYGSRNVSEVDG